MTVGDFERETLMRIYEAAQRFVEVRGGEVTLKETTIYLTDEPITGIRGVQMENADGAAKALARLGWIHMESGGNMISVHLTDAGIRAAQAT